MEQQENKHKLLKPLLVILIGIIIIGVTGFGVWYWQQNELKKQRTDSDKRISELQKQVNSQKNESEKATPATDTTPSTSKYSDKEALTIETMRKLGTGNPKRSYAIVDITIDGNWASSGAIPVDNTGNEGYEIPGIGGATWYWEKINGDWTNIGLSSEGGLQLKKSLKNRLNEISTKIISEQEKNSVMNWVE